MDRRFRWAAVLAAVLFRLQADLRTVGLKIL
jgi:hypothetical protein